MCRKSKFFCSILFRISIWYLLLGIAGVTVLYYVMEDQMHQNTEKYISEELLRVKENAVLYVCQVLRLHNNQINREGFRNFISDIEEQFKNAGYRDTAFYDTDGQAVGSGGNEKLSGETEREDFRLAEKQKSSFTLHYGADKACDVYFTMPVNVHGEQLGIISFYFDYHDIYKREWDAFSSMLHGIILVAGVIYIIIWLLVRRILAPIRRLTAVSVNISRHFEDGKLDIQMLSDARFYTRRDEIGELSRNYKEMLDVTKEQFEKIEQDRERIVALLNSRQEFYNSITHELKTPLAIISGYAQLIGENGLSDTELFHNGMAQILHESEYGETQTEIYIHMRQADGMVEIDVINQGKGLTEQELKRIFEPFFRVDKEQSRELGSAGLGLSIVKKIMDEHGGRIEAESIQGEYTVFSVFFPLIEGFSQKERGEQKGR